ncbi:MAG: methyltransferase domain-containing protein [Actinomycetota bacterium]|nr:methyltransferase domain-containing protein [Actinomycetota bacterium]
MTEPEGALVFDRAVDYYDRTRSISAPAMAQVVRLLSAELAPRGRCLEIGVGTGRVALPLAGAGVDIFGLDLSLPMMRKLVEKADTDGGRCPVVCADARWLPVPARSVACVLTVHVLHLIEAWREVLDEIARVIAPGGVFVMSHVTDPGSLWRATTERFRVEVGATSTAFPGVTDQAEVDAAMQARGATLRSLEPVVERNALTAEEVIKRLEDGWYSFTWSLDDPARRRAADATRKWAVARYGRLDRAVPSEYVIEWRCYDL